MASIRLGLITVLYATNARLILILSAFEKCGDVDQAYFMITKIYHESYIGVSLELVKGEIQPCVNRIEGIKEAIKDRDFELRKEIIAAMIGDSSSKDFIKRVDSIYN